MSFDPKDFAGSHCGCRYQQDYRPTLGRDGKKESGTLEVIKFYYDGAIRFEQHCYGEAATFVFGVWADHMDPDGTLHWVLPDRRKSYYDEDYLPKKLDRVDEAGNLYFDGGFILVAETLISSTIWRMFVRHWVLNSILLCCIWRTRCLRTATKPLLSLLENRFPGRLSINRRLLRSGRSM